MTSPERWARIEALLDAALDHPDADRDAWLRQACGGDEDLYREVSRILRDGERSAGLLDAPAARLAAPLLTGEDPIEAGALPLPQRLGPWRLGRELGRGGMGSVFLAERDDAQFQQRVALKVVRHGLHHDERFVRRFLDERQILASLEHPRIARLLDGGVTEAGLPWYAMEFVEGEPIDRFCDGRRLTVEERLRLFVSVCQGVQHAHDRRVVHRDIKPSNILVTAAGEPKLLDFGIAKLLESDEETQAGLTRTGQRLLTPEYASPEQVQGRPVSPATDVYSLGVLLYELLTGQRPFRRAGRSAHDLERAVLDEQPTRPSTAVTRLRDDGGSGGVTPARISEARRSTPDRLRRRLKGDLDAIVLQAMEKDPARRYPDAGALAEDVARHLAGQPVEARGERFLHGPRSWARRHRLAATTGVLGVLVGVGALGLATRDSPGQRALERGYRAAAQGTWGEATRSFEEALRLDSSLVMAALYGSEVASIDEDYAAAGRLLHVVEQRAKSTTGRDGAIVRAYLAWRRRAPELAARADSLRRRYPDAPEADLYAARAAFVAGDYLGAIAAYRRLARRGDAGPGGPGPCLACTAQLQMVISYIWADSLPAALREAEVLVEQQPASAAAWLALAMVHQYLDDGDESAYRQVLALDPSSADYAAEWLATRAIRRGEFAEADAILQGRIRTAPPGREERSMGHLITSLRYQERWDEARAMAARFRQLLPGDSGQRGAPPSAFHEAQIALEQGRFVEAAARFDSISLWRASDPSGTAGHFIWHQVHRADALAAAGDTALLRAILDTVRVLAPLSGAGRDLRLEHHVRGLLAAARGDHAGAAEAFRQAILSWNMGYTRTNYELARSLLALGRAEEAVRALQPALRGSLEVNNSYLTHTAIHRLLAEAWRRAGRPDSARAHEAWVARATGGR